MKYVIWFAIALLLILHQDFWLWNDGSLVLGFLPVGLAFHMGISVAAALLWWLATKFCWPAADEQALLAASADEGGRE